MRKLSPKQKLFVKEYLVDLNATQAAIRAEYSERTAQRIGSENLSKPLIAEAIQKEMADREKRVEINADWVLKKLVSEADADLAELIDEDQKLKKVSDWPIEWRRGLVSGIDITTSGSGDDTVSVVTKVKLSDRIKQTELIGKHTKVQAFKERIELDPSKDMMEFFKGISASKGPPGERS